MKILPLLFATAVMQLAAAAATSDIEKLRAHVRQSYPSLAYVEQYRKAYPDEVQSPPRPQQLRTGADLVAELAALQDQHVSLRGQRAGKTETLGILLRTSSDNGLVIWRVIDPALTSVQAGAGDRVLAVNGTPSAQWLTRSAATTFGGNRRARAAEAALELAGGTRVQHEVAGIGRAVKLRLQSGTGAPRDVELTYKPMDEERMKATVKALNQSDLPSQFEVGGIRVGTLRLGVFAPQFDPEFVAAADKAAAQPGKDDDQAMVAGFCAVVGRFMEQASAVAKTAEVLLLDVRGNVGGFGRQARLFAVALSPAAVPSAFDVFAAGGRGTLRLTREKEDPPCGHIEPQRPVLVLTDAGTRSSGEFIAAWLWGAGAVTAGERTIGAGGGHEFGGKGFPLADSGYEVTISGNFTFFDVTGTLREGEAAEKELLALVSRDRFAPSRTRPFAFQAVGLRPDLELQSTQDDLQDGGLAYAKRIVALAQQRKLLPRK